MVRHNEDQARSALSWIKGIDRAPWLAGERLTQADVTTVVMFDFTAIVNPPLVAPGTFPGLEELVARCNALPEFAATRPIAAVDQANPALSGC